MSNATPADISLKKDIGYYRQVNIRKVFGLGLASLATA